MLFHRQNSRLRVRSSAAYTCPISFMDLIIPLGSVHFAAKLRSFHPPSPSFLPVAFGDSVWRILSILVCNSCVSPRIMYAALGSTFIGVWLCLPSPGTPSDQVSLVAIWWASVSKKLEYFSSVIHLGCRARVRSSSRSSHSRLPSRLTTCPYRFSASVQDLRNPVSWKHHYFLREVKMELMWLSSSVPKSLWWRSVEEEVV